jgi:hypothetical protein
MAHKAARLTAATALGALVLAGCASSPTAAAPAAAPTPALARTAEPPPPVPPTPSAPDLRQFVIAPTDIPLPGFGEPTFGPLDESAVEGLTAYFESEDGERQLGQTIVLLPDADAARSALQGAATQTEQQRPGAQSTLPARGHRLHAAAVHRGAGLGGDGLPQRRDRPGAGRDRGRGR